MKNTYIFKKGDEVIEVVTTFRSSVTGFNMGFYVDGVKTGRASGMGYDMETHGGGAELVEELGGSVYIENGGMKRWQDVIQYDLSYDLIFHKQGRFVFIDKR